MDNFDPARTSLLVVHMAKGVAGPVDTPFSRLFRQRAEKKGVIGVQARLLDGFRKAKAKVVYTLVTYQPGLPGLRPELPAVSHARREPHSSAGYSRGRGHRRHHPPTR